jgi:hypothetical protein
MTAMWISAGLVAWLLCGCVGTVWLRHRWDRLFGDHDGILGLQFAYLLLGPYSWLSALMVVSIGGRARREQP